MQGNKKKIYLASIVISSFSAFTYPNSPLNPLMDKDPSVKQQREKAKLELVLGRYTPGIFPAIETNFKPSEEHDTSGKSYFGKRGQSKVYGTLVPDCLPEIEPLYIRIARAEEIQRVVP